MGREKRESVGTGLPSSHAAINWNIWEILHNFDTEIDTEIIAMALIMQLRHALETYSQDPEFDQNMVRHSEKCKLYWRDSGIECFPGSGIPQKFSMGRLIFCLSLGNPGNVHDPNKRFRQRRKRISQMYTNETNLKGVSDE